MEIVYGYWDGHERDGVEEEEEEKKEGTRWVGGYRDAGLYDMEGRSCISQKRCMGGVKAYGVLRVWHGITGTYSKSMSKETCTKQSRDRFHSVLSRRSPLRHYLEV